MKKSKFLFKHHYIDDNFPFNNLGDTVIADIDSDGVNDFVIHRQYGEIYWYDYESSNKWTRYLLGEKSPSDVAMMAFDVDGDGWIDIVTGGAWYRNSRDPKNKPFERFVFDVNLDRVHDIIAADIDGDGKAEIITMADSSNLRWYKIPDDPTQSWKHYDIGTSVHCGISVGDIDGDGDFDVVRSDVWYENINGDGTKWVEHYIGPCGGAPDDPELVHWQILATYTKVCDIDDDGKMDIVVADAEIVGAKIAWLENVDGKGLIWKRHELPQSDPDPRGAYHSLYIGDLDGDGDLDIFSCEQEILCGNRLPRFFIWENVDGKGKFIEHVILDMGLGGHCASVGDITGDGKLDICSKVWYPQESNGNCGRMHINFLENLGINPEYK